MYTYVCVCINCVIVHILSHLVCKINVKKEIGRIGALIEINKYKCGYLFRSACICV